MTASLELTDENIERILNRARSLFYLPTPGTYSYQTCVKTALQEERDRPVTFTVTVPASEQGKAYESLNTCLTASHVLFSIERSDS